MVATGTTADLYKMLIMYIERKRMGATQPVEKHGLETGGFVAVPGQDFHNARAEQRW